MNVDAVAVLVGLGAATLVLGAAVALVLRRRMSIPVCQKCGDPLRRYEEVRSCARCISEMAGG